MYNVQRKRVRWETPQKRTQFSTRGHLSNFVGKRTAYKDAIKDITSDSKFITIKISKNSC